MARENDVVGVRSSPQPTVLSGVMRFAYYALRLYLYQGIAKMQGDFAMPLIVMGDVVIPCSGIAAAL
jgi:hypothetical protein